MVHNPILITLNKMMKISLLETPTLLLHCSPEWFSRGQRLLGQPRLDHGWRVQNLGLHILGGRDGPLRCRRRRCEDVQRNGRRSRWRCRLLLILLLHIRIRFGIQVIVRLVRFDRRDVRIAGLHPVVLGHSLHTETIPVTISKRITLK